MKDTDMTRPQGDSATHRGWGWLKDQRIAYLTLPLLFMATVAEFVILATGWKYQQLACLPPGMGVTFFKIGPIGATILAVELLKLPLAIWTASRSGWQKCFMLVIGLPLISVLTFQLVKDMAVYEMGVAMTPASQMLAKASAEEVKIAHLNDELAAIEKKKGERDDKLAELAARQAMAKTALEDSLKRNDETRQDAISLTDYQKKELSEVETRQATIIQQFNADAEQLAKTISDLRANRETELARAAKWNAEEARIENVYKEKLAQYSNEKAAYEKARADYDNANVLKRQLMRKPVSPGVPPERESNPILKSTLVAELDAQIKAKEAELLGVNDRRRERVAQVGADARQLREQFDQRSTTKREASDRNREEYSAAIAALAKEEKAAREQIDKDYDGVVQKVDGIRAEIDASRKKAEALYEAREASIRGTQVHRIATTVEIVRSLLKGERPMSIKATAKERGDVLTDQISMVRVWVYPVLAFIVALLPTMMVEIGFSTIFKPQQLRPPYRVGFLGRGLHWLYIRAGRQKILRAERLAHQASAEIAAHDKALAAANAAADKTLAEKEAELQTVREAMSAAAVRATEQLQSKETEWAAKLASMADTLDRTVIEKDALRDKALAAAKAAADKTLAEKEADLQTAREALSAAAVRATEQLKNQETAWVDKLAAMADTLNRTVIEKDALRDLQKSEIERQIQMRQNAWSDRLTQLRQELDTQRAASEAERTALMQEHHKKLLEVSEDSKTQVIEARRQAANADLAAVEATAKLTHDLKEALNARDAAESQLRHQADSLSLQLTQAKEDAALEMEKAARQEKHRLERQQLEFAKTLRQREDDFAHQLSQREQELALGFEARLAEQQARNEQDARRHQAEMERQFEARALDVDARWKLEVQQREEAAQARLKQREQQFQAQAELRASENRTQAEQEWRRRESEFERQIEAQSRASSARLEQELQQKEIAFQAKLKQREQELALSADDRETELRNQLASDLRAREEELERQAESRIRAIEARLGKELQQKEELFLSKSRQHDQQWQAKMDATRAELHAQAQEALRRRDAEADARLRELEARMRQEMQQKDDTAQARTRQVEQELVAQLTAQAEARLLAAKTQWKLESEVNTRAAIESSAARLARAEKEREEARQSASEATLQVQHLEKKLSEASSFLNGGRNGKPLIGAV